MHPEGQQRALLSSGLERLTLVAFYPVDASGGGRNSAIIRTISANRFFEIAIVGHPRSRQCARGRRPSRRSQSPLRGRPRDRSTNRNVWSGRHFGVPEPPLEVRSPALLSRSQASHDRRHQWRWPKMLCAISRPIPHPNPMHHRPHEARRPAGAQRPRSRRRPGRRG